MAEWKGGFVPHESQGVKGFENKPISKKFETEKQKEAFDKKHEGMVEFHRHRYLEPYEVKSEKARAVARAFKEHQKSEWGG